MKVISNEKTATNTVELVVAVSGEQLQEKMQEVFLKQSKDINVPGFRKGKAPRKIIEKRYGEAIFLEDAVNELYPEAYTEAIKETGLEPVAPGDVEVTEVDIQSGFTFKAIVTTKPEVVVGEYKGIEATKVIPEVADELIDTEMNRLCERGARMIDINDRPAENGDITTIDFEGFVDDLAFEGGKGEDQSLELGTGSFIEGFEEQVVGKNVGESFDVNVTFPEEYHAHELAGKPAVFKVALKEIKRKELPALDDEFAKDVSEFDTIAELKEDTRKTLLEQVEKTSQDDLENSLVDAIVDGLDGEIPPVMYESRVDQMVEDFSHRLSHQGLDMDMYLQYTGMDKESFRKTFQVQAERQVKIRLALEKIVGLEKIVPSEEDLEKEFANMAETYEMPVEQLKTLVRTEDLIKDVAANLAIDMVRNSAKIKEITVEEKAKLDEAEAKIEEKVKNNKDKEAKAKTEAKPKAKKEKKESK